MIKFSYKVYLHYNSDHKHLLIYNFYCMFAIPIYFCNVKQDIQWGGGDLCKSKRKSGASAL